MQDIELVAAITGAKLPNTGFINHFLDDDINGTEKENKLEFT